MTVEVVAPAEGRLDAVLSTALPDISRSRLARLIRGGAVVVDGLRITRPATPVAVGATVTVDIPEPAPAEALPQDLSLKIVFEDAHVAVIDKFAGRVVHPGPGHPDGTLVNALLHHLDGLSGIGGVQRPGIVHRLDRGTSGLLVVAKHDQAHQSLARQFADHSAGRRYLALCHGAPDLDVGVVRTLVARHRKDRLRWASTDGTSGKAAVTHWAVHHRGGTVTLMECRLETGRTHQVRVHMSEQRWPLVGDTLYQRRTWAIPSRLRGVVDVTGARPLLHAWRLHFVHPASGESVNFEAPPPDDFGAALDALGGQTPTRSRL